jgi:hypothetical protein
MMTKALLTACTLLCTGQLAMAADKTAPQDTGAVTVASMTPCTVSCIDPHVCCAESQKVLEILEKLVTAYSHGDVKTYREYLDDHCTMFDEGTKKFISGKANVLTELERTFAEHAPGGPSPLKSLTIDQPYAKVNGDTCVVTFFATKEIAGAHPHTERAHVTDIFIKRDSGWKKLNWRGNWQPVTD